MATREEITSGLAEILEEVAGVTPDDVAEEKFGVKIPDNEVQNLKTVGDAVSYIEANH
jgi:acyl carrier protein